MAWYDTPRPADNAILLPPRPASACSGCGRRAPGSAASERLAALARDHRPGFAEQSEQVTALMQEGVDAGFAHRCFEIIRMAGEEEDGAARLLERTGRLDAV